MNIVMAVIGLVGLKCAPKCTISKEKMPKFDPPDHISGYGPAVWNSRNAFSGQNPDFS